MASEDTHHEPSSESVLVPAPTGWPFVTSFGIALMFLGLVTHLVVSAVGIVLLARGLIGWWTDVLPVEKHEHAPLLPEPLRAAKVVVARHSVEHLQAGEAGHRVKIPAEIHPYSSGIQGGIAGAAAMAVPAVAYGLISQGSVWYPINLLSAAAMPSMAAADDAHLKAFDATAFGVAAVSHLLISILVGLVYAVMLPMFGHTRYTWLWGGIAAPILWTGLVWASLDVLNPALNARVSWPWFVASQVAFGLTCGFVIARTQKVETNQTWPLAARAGLKAPYVPVDGGEEGER
jgi:hypothetical protein